MGAAATEIVLDFDASLITAHSEKEGPAGNYKGGFGFHPLFCYLAQSGEALAGLLRPGNATQPPLGRRGSRRGGRDGSRLRSGARLTALFPR